MKTHHITDEDIQHAIDAACQELSKEHSTVGGALTISSDSYPSSWTAEKSARRDLAKELLANLPDPPPPVSADGKTPGEVAFEVTAGNGYTWATCPPSVKEQWEKTASAVLAAFGGASLADKALADLSLRVANIAYDPVQPLAFAKAVADHIDDLREDINHGENVRLADLRAGQASQPLPIATLAQDQIDATPAMLEAADAVLREEMGQPAEKEYYTPKIPNPLDVQPAEIPWTEWHGRECPVPKGTIIDVRYRDGMEKNGIRALTIESGRDASESFWENDSMAEDIIAYRVLKWPEGFGPAAVDWKAKYEQAVKECDELRLSEYLYKRVTDALGIEKDIIGHVKALRTDKEKAEADLLSWKGNAERLSQDHAELSKELARVTIERNHAINTEKLAHRNAKLSTLRPIAEAGPVPAGCVRVTGYKSQFTDCGWILGEDSSDKDTHFTDIRLPAEGQAPATCEHGEKISDYCERCDAELSQAPAVKAEKPDDSKALGTPVNEIIAAIKPDPYAELKAAHATGKVIEAFNGLYWVETLSPAWIGAPQYYRVKPKPEPETFEAHGKTWKRHTPGDPMPCSKDAKVNVLTHGDTKENALVCCRAFVCPWEKTHGGWQIIGWRFADEPTPKPIKDWTPKVGDVVTLKSGGSKMTIAYISGSKACCYTFVNNVLTTIPDVPLAALQLA